ncbi:MAG TPA: hypothetical protein VF131_19010 [Blastocatellia bacterium]|nr:hypothetical protein [Blastocatellia bacterium]
MKRIMTVILLSLALSVAAFAQEAKPKPAEAMPTADQIIEKYVQAMGGKAAIEKLNSRTTKGTLDIPSVGMSGSVETYEKAPNKWISIANVAGFGSVQTAYDGTKGWSDHPALGLRDLAGVELANTKLEAEFHKAIKLKQLYPTITVKGKEKVGDKDAYLLEATPKEGTAEKWYFDAQTGLLIRTDAVQDTPEGQIPNEIYFDEYKEVDGVKVPVAMRISNPMFVINIKTQEVKHNVPVDDAKFNKPAAK